MHATPKMKLKKRKIGDNTCSKKMSLIYGGHYYQRQNKAGFP